MRVLLSTIGSRGDVQPLVALALELKALGQEVRLCVPPDFCDWIETLGLPVTPIGPELRSTAKPARRGADHARAPAPVDRRHGRHPIRNPRRGGRRLRPHRGSHRPADRRSLRRRTNGHPLRVRRLLPDRPPLATPTRPLS